MYVTEINIILNNNQEDDISALGEPTTASKSVLGTSVSNSNHGRAQLNGSDAAAAGAANEDNSKNANNWKSDIGRETSVQDHHKVKEKSKANDNGSKNNNNNNDNNNIDEDDKMTSIAEDYDYAKAYLEKSDGVSLLSQTTDPSVAACRLGQEQQPIMTKTATTTTTTMQQEPAEEAQETSLLRGMGLTERSIFSDDASFDELFLDDPNWTKFDVTARPGKLGMVIDAVDPTAAAAAAAIGNGGGSGGVNPSRRIRYWRIKSR